MYIFWIASQAQARVTYCTEELRFKAGLDPYIISLRSRSMLSPLSPILLPKRPSSDNLGELSYESQNSWSHHQSIVRKPVKRIFVSRFVLTFTSDAILHKFHAVWTNTLVASFRVHTCTICTRILLTFVGV